MALTGATVTEIIPGVLWRVFGGQLDAGAVGHIATSDYGAPPAGTVPLVADPGENRFRDPGPLDGNSLEDTTEVTINAMGAVALVAALQVRVEKLAAATLPRLLVTLTNDDGVNGTPELDIYVRIN